MSDRFLKNMNHMLENTQSLSLKILFEEKDGKSDDAEDKKSDDTFDAFSSDEDKKDSDDDISLTSGDEEGDETLSGDDEGEGSDSDDEESSQVYDDLHDLSDFAKTVNDANDEKERVKKKFKFNPEHIISAGFNRSSRRKSSLTFKSLMLMKEESDVDKTLDKVEKSLEDEQERIEKLGDDAHAISSKIKKGHKINFEKEASDALSNFKNFDAKFSKSEIIANMYIDKISELSSPQELERNIKDFLSRFNQLLPETDKIDIQIQPTSYNTGTGGKTPSG